MIPEKVKAVLDKLEMEAKAEANHLYSPVTSIAEDFEIRRSGEDRLSVIRKIRSAFLECADD